MRDDAANSRRSNVRTALLLASVALAFFIGIVLKYWMQR
jgi:hypothetical protein